MTKKKHILFVSYDGMTDSLGQSQVLPYIREISKSNFIYTLISFEKKERFLKQRENIQMICNESNIDWHPISYSGAIPILSTIWNVFRLKNKVFYLHAKNKFDLFHSRSHVPSLVAQMLQKKHKVPYVFDMRGFWADERVDGGVWNLKNPIFKKVFDFFKRKELEFIQEANAIVSLTHNGKQEILSWQKLTKTALTLKTKDLQIEVIPCCVDTELFNIKNIETKNKNEIKTKLGITDEKWVIGYVGSIGTWYMLPEMLDFFKVLKTNKPESIFLFITNESEEKIKSIAIQKGIDTNDIKVASCFHKEVPTYISLFDISIYFILPAYSKKASSPTKQGELMAMGIPIVCNANVGDADKIISETESGWVIHEFNENAYKITIDKITSSPLPISELIIQNGIKEFNLKVGAEKFRNTYERILQIENLK
jgi:glycosyltransferase involved in cell wall biosynthesis